MVPRSAIRRALMGDFDLGLLTGRLCLAGAGLVHGVGSSAMLVGFRPKLLAPSLDCRGDALSRMRYADVRLAPEICSGAAKGISMAALLELVCRSSITALWNSPSRC